MVRALLIGLVVAAACGGKGESKDEAKPSLGDTTAEQAEMPLPAVSGPGVEPIGDDRGGVVVVTQTAIVVEGRQLVAVKNGQVDAAEKIGGAGGRFILKVQKFVAAVLDANRTSREARQEPLPASQEFLVALHPSTPASLIMEVAGSLGHAGVDRIGLLAHGPDAKVSVPIALPAAPAPEPPGALGLMLAVTVDRLVLFSASGLEGTMQKPLLEVVGFDRDKLRAALADVVARRLPDGKRSAADRRIVVIIDPKVTAEQALPLLAAVRAGDRGELFPDVLLSPGFR